MKTIFSILLVCLIRVTVYGQTVLSPITALTQEHDQWCWAGCSKVILDYYGYSLSQCQIAEYTRSVATWHNYGSNNCCNTPFPSACNYWNYVCSTGDKGEISDILMTKGNIQTICTKTGGLTTSVIQSDLSQNRPFVIRWQWSGGGGHFIIGYGIGTGTNPNIYYMNPWQGEGKKIALHSWVKSGSDGNGTHSWDYSLRMGVSPSVTGINSTDETGKINLYPNPANKIVNFNSGLNITELKVYDHVGRVLLSKKIDPSSLFVTIEDYPAGVYNFQFTANEGVINKKVALIK